MALGPWRGSTKQGGVRAGTGSPARSAVAADSAYRASARDEVTAWASLADLGTLFGETLTGVIALALLGLAFGLRQWSGCGCTRPVAAAYRPSPGNWSPISRDRSGWKPWSMPHRIARDREVTPILR